MLLCKLLQSFSDVVLQLRHFFDVDNINWFNVRVAAPLGSGGALLALGDPNRPDFIGVH